VKWKRGEEGSQPWIAASWWCYMNIRRRELCEIEDKWKRKVESLLWGIETLQLSFPWILDAWQIEWFKTRRLMWCGNWRPSPLKSINRKQSSRDHQDQRGGCHLYLHVPWRWWRELEPVGRYHRVHQRRENWRWFFGRLILETVEASSELTVRNGRKCSFRPCTLPVLRSATTVSLLALRCF